MSKRSLLIYGAYGYTGQLILEEAIRRGHHPTIGGRDLQKLAAQADRFKVPSLCFELRDDKIIEAKLKDVHTVLHCAGPFSSTHRPMFNACLATGTNYLDITGEIPIFERVQRKREEIEKAGIVAIPGVGFDVIPSDCLAAELKSRLPDATHLTLAFKYTGRPSKGTLKTVVEGLPAGSVIRLDGKLKMVRAASRFRDIEFEKGKRDRCMGVPWGDLSTAFYSTGIPNIETFTVISPAAETFLRYARFGSLFLVLPPVRKGLQRLIDWRYRPDTEKQFKAATASMWGEARNSRGETVERRFVLENGYKVTAQVSIRAAEQVLSGAIRPGAYTPSQAFGQAFAEQTDTIRAI